MFGSSRTQLDLCRRFVIFSCSSIEKDSSALNWVNSRLNPNRLLTSLFPTWIKTLLRLPLESNPINVSNDPKLLPPISDNSCSHLHHRLNLQNLNNTRSVSVRESCFTHVDIFRFNCTHIFPRCSGNTRLTRTFNPWKHGWGRVEGGRSLIASVTHATCVIYTYMKWLVREWVG